MASQLVAGMWTDFSNIAGYAYNAAGANCAFTGGAGNAAVNAWATNVQAALPGASAQVVFGVNNLHAITALGLSALIGILAGVIPATMASRFKIVEALRRVA